MKKNLQSVLLAFVFLGSLIWVTGCYTQVAMTRDEYTPPDENRDEYSSTTNDTSANPNDQGYADENYNDDNWAPGYRYGFDYYYPTFGFSYGSYDPWWRAGGWYYYDPFLCGTYYPAIYAGWNFWYPPSFYWYGYGHHGSHFYAGGGHGFHGGVRTVGSTRGTGVVRGGRGSEGFAGTRSAGAGNLPTGLRAPSSTRNTPSGNTPRVSTGRRSNGSRAGVGRSGAGVRGGTSRGGSRGRTQATTPRTYTPPRRSAPGRV